MPDISTQVHIDGKALRERRISADLSPEQLARDAGLPQGQIEVLEDSGWALIDPQDARGLIEALVCHFDDLFVVMEVDD